MSPPYTSTIFLQTFKPNPIPYQFYFQVEFSLPNILNNFTWSTFLIPIPVSITEKSSIRLSLSKLQSTMIDPVDVNFSAFEIKFINTYLILLSSEVIQLGIQSVKFILKLMHFAAVYKLNISYISLIIALNLILSSIFQNFPFFSIYTSNISLTRYNKSLDEFFMILVIL